MAAKCSVGIKDENTCTNRKINLTQLRQNTRNRKEKKSGRKVPRPDDYEIVPAPDSEKQVNNCFDNTALISLYIISLKFSIL